MHLCCLSCGHQPWRLAETLGSWVGSLHVVVKLNEPLSGSWQFFIKAPTSVLLLLLFSVFLEIEPSQHIYSFIEKQKARVRLEVRLDHNVEGTSWATAVLFRSSPPAPKPGLKETSHATACYQTCLTNGLKKDYTCQQSTFPYAFHYIKLVKAPAQWIYEAVSLVTTIQWR